MTKWCKQRSRAVSVCVARFMVKGEYLCTFYVFPSRVWHALKKRKAPIRRRDEMEVTKKLLVWNRFSRTTKEACVHLPRRGEQARKNVSRLEHYASSQSYKHYHLSSELWILLWEKLWKKFIFAQWYNVNLSDKHGHLQQIRRKFFSFSL